jgi:hypothetical protein
MKRNDYRKTGLPMRRAPLWFLSACVALAMCSSPAYAYLDPGTGSILMQAIIGTLAAGAAVMAGMRHKIGAFLYRLKNGDEEEKRDAKNHGGEKT